MVVLALLDSNIGKLGQSILIFLVPLPVRQSTKGNASSLRPYAANHTPTEKTTTASAVQKTPNLQAEISVD